MRKLLICAAAAAATLVGPLSLQAPSAQSSTIARVIVKYRADSTLLRKQALSVTGQQTLQASALGNRIGIALDAGRAISDRSHVVIGRGMTSQQLAAQLAAQSDIEYAVPDERKRIVEVPTDPFYASGPAVGPTSGGPAVGQWYLKPPAAASTAAHTAPAAINAEKAWDITKGSIAHFGTYRVEEDEAGKALMLHIEGSTFPNWAGTEQRRSFSLSGDELSYISPGSTGVATQVVLRRAK